MIRRATLEDIPGLVLFVLRCEDTMQWKEHGFCTDISSVTETLISLATNQDACVFVVVKSEAIIGACAATISGIPWNKGARVAQEWIWHMHPDFPDGQRKRSYFVKLLDAMLVWARSNGARVFKASSAKQHPAAQRLLERRGIRAMETVCAGGL